MSKFELSKNQTYFFSDFLEFFLKFSRIFSRFFVQKIVIQNVNKLLWYFSGLLRHSVYTVRYGVSDTINTRIPPNKKPNFQNCHWHEKHWIKNIERKFVVHGLKKVMMKKIIEKQIEYFFSLLFEVIEVNFVAAAGVINLEFWLDETYLRFRLILRHRQTWARRQSKC